MEQGLPSTSAQTQKIKMGAQLSSPPNNMANEDGGGITDEETLPPYSIASPPARILWNAPTALSSISISNAVRRLPSPRRRKKEQKRTSQHDGRSNNVEGCPSPIKKKVDGRKKNNDVQGFDALAAVLSEHHNEFVSKQLTTDGLLTNKWKQLRNASKPRESSNAAAISSPRSVAGLVPTISPTNHHHNMDSPASPLFSPSPMMREDPLVAPLYLMSSTQLGMRRLPFKDIVRLKEGDEFIIVLHQPSGKRPSNVSQRVWAESNSRRKPNYVSNDVWSKANTQWYAILGDFQKTVLDGIAGSGEEMDAIYKQQLSHRSFQRDGQEYYELHLTVQSCPEQETLRQYNLSERTINNLIEKPMNVLGDGFHVQLYGYGSFLLRYATLPYVEVYVARRQEDPYLDNYIGKFPRSNNEDTMLTALKGQLHATNGDMAATVQVMMGYYHHSYTQMKQQQRQQQQRQQQQPIDDTKIFHELISKELTSEELVRFASMIDNDYRERMLDLYSDFSEATPYLISEEQHRQYHNQLKRTFPNTYRVLHTIASSKYFPLQQKNVDDDMSTNCGDDNLLQTKERQLLFVFYALLRTKSRNHLNHWSQVDSLARCYKGHQQPGGKNFAGSFHSTLPTSLKKQQDLYLLGSQRMSDKLRRLAHVSGAFDNHNRIINKKSNSDGKSAISHIGTATCLKQDRPFQLLRGTKIVSPSGIEFDLTKCSKTNDPFIYLLKGTLTSMIPEDAGTTINHEKSLIESGQVEWPTLGWTVMYMPGFTPRSELVYAGQIVTPPQLAWISSNTSNSSLVLNPKRKLVSPLTKRKKSLDSKSYIDCHQLARRLVDMNSHVYYLTKLKERFHTVHDESTTFFIRAIRDAAPSIAAAASFQRDIVQQINPNAGKVDRMYLFPIIPYSETSNNEMKMAYAEMGKCLQLFEIDDKGRVLTVENSDKRRINLGVDALSARNFRELEYTLSRKLGEVGASPYVKAMIDSLSQITVENDYLHETRFHRLDCIYRLYYGAFLQPLQVHLGWKKINGDPVKNKIQPHEQFMWIVYNALRRHRFDQFIKNMNGGEFKRQENVSTKVHLLRLDKMYSNYCNTLEQSMDQPTRVSALFMKCVESYNRCFNGVRNSDFWLMEIEGSNWLGAFKLCDKTNYVTETLHRMDTLYKPNRTDFDLEWTRRNRFFVMTEGGRGMSFDEVNELQNLWNKSCAAPHDFTTVCEMSQHLMVMRMASFEVYGRNRRSTVNASQETSIAKLVTLFETVLMFDQKVNQREMTDNFFWDNVTRPVGVGSKSDERKEKVAQTISAKILYSVICSPDGETIQIEEDDDNNSSATNNNDSVVSSCAGSQHHGTIDLETDEFTSDNVEPWETLNEEVSALKIADSLKKVGNVRKKKMSKLILKDMLGDDGKNQLKQIKKKHEKTLKRKRKKIDDIHKFVQLYEEKMTGRRAILCENIAKSEQNTFESKSYWWKDEYKKLMDQRNGDM
eukprot:scaffold3571_cov78-Skeletonema_dohrnii-CCMP3373.AAC.3